MTACAWCARPPADHTLAEAWRCLDILALSAATLAARVCGESAAAALEIERRRRVLETWSSGSTKAKR